MATCAGLGRDVPATLDGARVLQVADVSRVPATGRTRHFVRGELAGGFAALAVATYDKGDDGCYLFYCDESWEVVTDTFHDTAEGAVGQAEWEYGPLMFHDVTT